MPDTARFTFTFGEPRAVPAGWPPDVAPHDIITANHMNAVKTSVYQWPGNVDAGGFRLKSAVLEAGSVDDNLKIIVPAKATAATYGEGSGLYMFSPDASNPLQGFLQLVTGATAAERRLTIGAAESGISWNNITLAEMGGHVGIGIANPQRQLHISRPGPTDVDLQLGNGVNNIFLSLLADGSGTLQTQLNMPIRVVIAGAVAAVFQSNGMLLPVLPAANPGAGTKALCTIRQTAIASNSQYRSG